jgi:hypothetical protein
MVFGCIPVFFHHSENCSRAMPLEELPGISLRQCSLDIDLESVKNLPQTLKSVSNEQRGQFRVRLPHVMLENQLLPQNPKPLWLWLLILILRIA